MDIAANIAPVKVIRKLLENQIIDI